ncbi:anti-sigma factor RsbA family regulatory protein [Dactylosporangium sp. NPDC049525]|uniref:anti-sigma factor RsbA family regulatory protein n=1 Tax=Dactylosporangium sp. NPDC049525 TaxID=3154730 RepID=UPI0034371529
MVRSELSVVDPGVPALKPVEARMAVRDRLTHDAFFYGTDERFTDVLAPFVRDGLERDHAVVAAVTPANAGLLRDALGPDATTVTFIDRDDWYRRPASTVAGWRRLLADATGRGHDTVRIIGEVGFGPPARHVTWTRYESALNAVFADAPAWIVCPYDTRVLPRTVLADARRTHPSVTVVRRAGSGAYRPPEQFLDAVPEPAPPVDGPPTVVAALGESVADARHLVRHVAVEHGWDGTDRLDELLLVTSEIAANAVLHGGGRRELRVWTSAMALVCEVSDDGPGPTDPLAGYRPPDESMLGGRGMWIARQLCEALAVSRDDGWTRVRYMLLHPPV